MAKTKIYSVDQPVWKIEIKKYSGTSKYSTLDKSGVFIEDLKIIGMSRYKIVVNNDWFSTFDLPGDRKSSFDNYLDKTRVSVRTGAHILGDGVFIELCSSNKPTKAILKRMVAMAAIKIDKEFGFLFGGVKDELYSMVDLADIKNLKS